MLIKLKKAMLSCVLAIVLLVPFAMCGVAKDSTPKLTFGDELELLTLKENNFLEFGNILVNEGMTQTLLIKNNNEKETEFYLQLVQQDEVGSSVDIKDKEFIESIINDDNILKITDDKGKIIYNETSINVLHDVQDHKVFKIASLKQDESININFLVKSKYNLSQERYRKMASQVMWRITVKQNGESICILDNSIKPENISREMLKFKGKKTALKFNANIVYVCIGVVGVTLLVGVFIIKTGKFNSLPDEDG